MNPTTLKINDQLYSVIDIQQFREMYHLTSEFSITRYEQKDYTGLAKLQAGSPAFTILRAVTLAHIPKYLEWSGLLPLINQLSHQFRAALESVNDTIGLKQVEIDFAAAGFEDVCHAFSYALIRGKTSRTSVSFIHIYHEWLNGTNRVTHTPHTYQASPQAIWQIRVINNAYGRVGLLVELPNETVVVRDAVYACPAESFMYTLLTQVAANVLKALDNA